MMHNKNHIPVLDHLRGIAALSVCLFHFAAAEGVLPKTDPIHIIGSYGYLGVQAFFVISGFVVPYSLHLRKYRLKDAGDFFARRLKRLEPPYFACILLCILLQFTYSLAPGFRGARFSVGVTQLLAHVAYLNALLKYPWINVVFWTLAIEFQYYIFIAIVFPLLNSHLSSVRVVSLASIVLFSGFGFGDPALLPHWLPLFAYGITAFQFYVGHLKGPSFIVFCLLISVVSYVTVGPLETAVSMLTTAAIVLWAGRQVALKCRWLAFAGTLSYSIYLMHLPTGGRIIYVAMTRLPDSVVYRYPAIVLAFAVTMVSAYLFWIVVERPSQQWAKSRPILSIAANAPSDDPDSTMSVLDEKRQDVSA